MTRTIRLLAPPAAVCAAVLALAAAGAQGSAPPPPGGGAVTASATGPSGATGATAPLTAALSACHTDPVPANRYAIFASQMLAAPVPGTLEMAVDFDLQERAVGAAVFTPVDATGFGVWIASQPHVGIFAYNHEVTALPAPAAFRVLVRARWIGRRRRVLHATSTLSPVCMQPLLVADLVIGRIARVPGGAAGTAQYSVEVRNQGNADAGPFQVGLTVGTTALPAAAVPGLAAGASAQVTFDGPACGAGSSVTATADPSHQIAEPTAPRRTRVVGCPVPF